MDYRKCLACVCLTLLVELAHAQALHVEALRLAPLAPWQRGDAAREAEDQAFLLEHPEHAALQVILPRQAPRLKVDASEYYRNLERQWQVRYGIGTAIEPVEIAGARWLMNRRATRARDATLFHLSRVFDGRAYGVLIFAPLRTRALPPEAHDLLAAIRFESTPTTWHKARVYRSQPGAETLAALLGGDADAPSAAGMITGYGLRYGEASAQWFVEGFHWDEHGARPRRVDWRHAGTLEASVPATWTDAAEWRLRVITEPDSAALQVGWRTWQLCAPRAELEVVLERLKRGVFGPLERLARQPAPGCGVMPRFGETGQLGVADDAPVELRGQLPPPAAQTRDAALRHVLLLEAYLRAEPGTPGEGLLDRVRLYFVYQPEHYLSDR